MRVTPRSGCSTPNSTSTGTEHPAAGRPRHRDPHWPFKRAHPPSAPAEPGQQPLRLRAAGTKDKDPSGSRGGAGRRRGAGGAAAANGGSAGRWLLPGCRPAGRGTAARRCRSDAGRHRRRMQKRAEAAPKMKKWWRGGEAQEKRVGSRNRRAGAPAAPKWVLGASKPPVPVARRPYGPSASALPPPR